MMASTSEPRQGVAQGTLYIVSAASGTGKTSLVRALAERQADTIISVSHTTRAQRTGEVEGEHYHFVDAAVFSGMLERAEFLESALVFGNRYGTSQAHVQKQLKRGVSVILEIDWQGARQVRKQMPCITIFVLPPSLETLRARLEGRGQDSSAVIDERMRGAADELSHYAEFDYLLVNDDFETACGELQSIMQATNLLATRQHPRHAALIASLLGASPE
jgi:guanylate kinase